MKKRINAFKYALSGLRCFFIETPHAKFHLLAVAVVCSAGFFWNISTIEWAIVLLCMGLVISLEAINSALEYTVDIVSPTYNELAKKAKDVAAGAVLVAAFVSFIIALLIFMPKIF